MLQQTNAPSTLAAAQQREPQASPTKAIRLQASRWMSCSNDDISPRAPSRCRSGERERWQSSNDLSAAAVESSRQLPCHPSRRHQNVSSCSSSTVTTANEESRWSSTSSSTSSSSSSEITATASLSRPIRRGSIVTRTSCGAKSLLNYATTPMEAVYPKMMCASTA